MRTNRAADPDGLRLIGAADEPHHGPALAQSVALRRGQEARAAHESLSGGRGARRFDPAARASVDRLVHLALQGLCALAAVVAVHAAGSSMLALHWAHWRLWAVLFPVAILLLPTAVPFRSHNRRLVIVLEIIGATLRSAAVIASLEVLLIVAAIEAAAWPVLVALFAANLLLLVGSRTLSSKLVRGWRRPLRIVIVGADEQGISMARHLASQSDVEIVGFVDDRHSRLDLSVLPAPYLGRVGEFMARLDQAPADNHAVLDVDGAVIALPNSAGARVEALAATVRSGVLNVYLAPDATVLRRGLVGRQAGGLEATILLGVERLPLQGRIWKRLFDIAFASVALALFLPVGLVIAALIKWESPGPVIFRQKRFGLGNVLFDVYKFRSMRFEPAVADGPIRLTERGDSRVTRIGEFLRRTSLDEFPQFLNVLKGDMSVVGPRPHPPGVKAGERIYEEVVADFMERYKARPGITGWAQVNGLRGNTFTEDHITQRFAFDIQYLRNWSFELDVLIVLKTVWGGFGGTNAF